MLTKGVPFQKYEGQPEQIPNKTLAGRGGQCIFLLKRRSGERVNAVAFSRLREAGGRQVYEQPLLMIEVVAAAAKQNRVLHSSCFFGKLFLKDPVGIILFCSCAFLS